MADYALPAVSDDEPCGPDLDFAGDAEFLNYMAAIDGQLPAKSYFAFKDDKDGFSAFLTALPTLLANGEKLLNRTQDIRLLLGLAKLSILSRDFAGFVKRIGQIGWLLENRWEAVHPRAEDGDFASRLGQLNTLDDGPAVTMPLQYATLLETRRDGQLMFRAQMVASGDAKSRESEQLPTAGGIERILSTVEMSDLAAAVERAEDLSNALAAMYRISAEQVGFEQAINLKDLPPLVGKIRDFLKAAQERRDPSFAPTETSEASADGAGTAAGGEKPAAAPGSFTSLTDVDQALGAALGYFQRNEPSSPAVLLIGQARESLGKDLYAVMRLLAPAHADVARLFVGPEGAFTVQVSALANATLPELERSEPEPSASRAAALSLIDAVAAHMRRAEPSSPAPFLLERARALASRDFLSLLHELMPEDNLDAMKHGK